MKQGTKMSISHFIFLFLTIPLSLCLSGVGTAAGYMKTIHHCIFTIKLLTEKRTWSYIGYILQGWAKTKVTRQ